MTLCPFDKYKNIFGKIGEGAHSMHRVYTGPVGQYVPPLRYRASVAPCGQC